MSLEAKNALCEIIKKAREDKGLTLTKVSNSLRLDEAYLQSIESGEFEKLPAAYERMFLKSYMKFLSLDTEENLKLVGKIFNLPEEKQNLQPQKAAERPSKPLMPMAKHVAWFPIVLVVLLFIYISYTYINTAVDEPEPVAELSLKDAIATIDTVTIDTAKFMAAQIKNDSLTLNLHVLEPVYLFARADSLHEHKISGKKFQHYQIKAANRINLYMSDGSRVNVTFNDSNYGVLTPPDYRVNFMIFTIDGLVNRGISKKKEVNDSLPTDSI